MENTEGDNLFPDIALPQSRGSPEAGAYWDACCHTRVGPFPWENESHQEINFDVRIRTLLFNVHSNKSSVQAFVYSRFKSDVSVFL